MLAEASAKPHILSQEEHTALEKLIVDQWPFVFRLIKKRHPGHTKQWCEDVTQETIICALKAMDRFDPEKKLQTWLGFIALRCAISHFRKEEKHQHLVSLTDTRYDSDIGDWIEDFHDPQPEAYMQQQETRWELEQALGQIDPDQANILRLFHLQGMQNKDIAMLYHITATAMSSRLKTARTALRKILASAKDR